MRSYNTIRKDGDVFSRFFTGNFFVDKYYGSTNMFTL